MADKFLGSESALAGALFSVIPAPFDGGATFLSGQADAPKAICEASLRLETFDEETGYDIFADDAIHAVDVADAPRDSSVQSFLTQQITAALDAVAVPVILGGDGTVSYAAIKTLAERAHKDKQELSVLHLDAHADLNSLDRGDNNLSVMSKALKLSCKNIKLYEVGVRSLSKAAFDRINDDENDIDCMFMSDLREVDDKDWQGDVAKALSTPVYVSIDLSVFDPAFLPNVGNPEPEGFGWTQVLGLLRRVANKRRIAGFDLVELTPNPQRRASDFIVAKLAYKIMNAIVAGGKMLPKPA
jgi:agmatinase